MSSTLLTRAARLETMYEYYKSLLSSTYFEETLRKYPPEINPNAFQKFSDDFLEGGKNGKGQDGWSSERCTR